MRILHIATRHRRGGAERNLAFTIQWELEQGHEVHLAVGRDSLPEEMPAGAIKHVIQDLVRAVSPVRDVRAYRSMRALIARGRFDMVHTHQSKAGILGRLAARGLSPIVLHTIHMASFGPAYNGIASLGFIAAERYCARFSTRIVAVGQELVAMYRRAEIGRTEQYRVIHSPIDLTAFFAIRALPASARRDARVSLGLSPDRRTGLVVASLEPRKRVDLVLRALAPVVRAGGLQLAVAGDGPERARLEALARDLDIASRVVLLGHVQDVPGAMAASDVLIHAATVEGVPQVVVQALAAGLPVAATEMLGLREIPKAPVFVGRYSGEDLADTVEGATSTVSSPVPEDRLGSWSPSTVREALIILHGELSTAA